MNVVFTGGGTGGHLYPAIAIADALRQEQRDLDVTFVGTADRLETTIVPKAGYALRTVSSRPLTRKPSLELLRTILANARGIAAEFANSLRYQTLDIVIATGGYVCFPVVLAARVLRALRRLDARIVLLEPNAHPGLTNRLLAPLVDEVWGAFPKADDRFAGKYVHTGIPVRASLRALPGREAALERLGLSAKRQTLARDGRQPGRAFDQRRVDVARKADGLPEGWQLIHVTGEREYDRVRSALGKDADAGGVRPVSARSCRTRTRQAISSSRAPALRRSANSRRPASPSILVPYPHAADDHQRANAERLAETGAAVVVERSRPAGR